MSLSLILVSAGLLSAFAPDTVRTATIVADRGMVVSRTDTVAITNHLSITDVLQQDPALLVNDTGGAAGIKTVSLRGLGSTHTAIYVDGVRVGNLQSGQTDLGTLGIENFNATVVDYAQNSVSFLTARPEFTDGRKVKGNFNFNAGSFGTYMPSGRLDFKLSDKVSLSANAAAISSKGDFVYDEGQRRENNDIRQIKGGVDLFGGSSYSRWHVKAYANGSESGSPGTVSWPSDDRQKNTNAFVQGLFKRDFSRYNLTLSSKISYDDMAYTSSWGDSRYGQTEIQLNSSHLLHIRSWWDVSIGADVQWDDLNSTNYDNSRFGTVGSLATAFTFKRFRANASVEFDGAWDDSGSKWTSLSPALDLRYHLLENLDVTAFARRARRTPCFNELYYVGYGNPDLKPEDATLMDLGLDWHASVGGKWSLKAKLDGFRYFLVDKIVSAPSAEDPNIWQPYNVDKVRSTGLDASAGFGYREGLWTCSFDAAYSYQSAVDRTPDSYSYGEQIAYVAKHTAVLSGKAGFRNWNLNAVWNLRAGRRDSYGEMPDWNTLDVTLLKAFSLKEEKSVILKLMGRNLADCRYELSSGYPMPGRSVTGGVEFKF